MNAKLREKDKRHIDKRIRQPMKDGSQKDEKRPEGSRVELTP